jgi:hypothetical protein
MQVQICWVVAGAATPLMKAELADAAGLACCCWLLD